MHHVFALAVARLLSLRHAFDFDAASSTFREHLKNEGVDFTPEATSAAVRRSSTTLRMYVWNNTLRL